VIARRPRPRLAGSSDVADRDLERLETDLAAREPGYPATHSRAVKWLQTRIAPGTHSPA
jgi:hypothetical protein